jgi:hypothetical protein
MTGIVMKLLIIAPLAVLIGCASAEQRMESRADYRDAQVEAIKVQAEQATARRSSQDLADAAMWQSLAEAVKANPESASHFAIVMAVAASNGKNSEPQGATAMATLKSEREVLPIDYVKAVAPALIGTLGNVGTAAIAADQIKESIKANRDIRITEAQVDGKMWDTLTAGFGEAGDNANIIINGSDELGDQAGDSIVDDQFPTDEEPVDEEPVDTTEPDPADDVVDPDPVDPDPADNGDEIDCNVVMFSPKPPECL